MNFFQKYFKGDRIIWVTVLLLSIISVLAVYSSIANLAYTKAGGHTGGMMMRHVFYLILSLLLMFLVHRVKYTYFSRLSQILICITVVLLFITMVSGRSVNSASRWLDVFGFSFQTSEMAKVVIIVFLSRCLAKNKDNIDDFKKSVLPMFIWITAVVILIFRSNFSTAILIFGTSVVLLYIGRVKIKYILSFVASIFVVLFIGYLLLKAVGPAENNRSGVWENRIVSFVDDDADNFQRDQAKIAIANGGVLGKMPGNSFQRIRLPQVDCDFIYSLIVEEYGLFGGIIVLVLYLIILYRGVRNAVKAPGTFGAYLSIGLSMMIVFQALLHMGINANVFPATGLNLPLVSRGGSSMLFTGISMGIILSVSRGNEEKKEEVNNEQE